MNVVDQVHECMLSIQVATKDIDDLYTMEQKTNQPSLLIGELESAIFELVYAKDKVKLLETGG